MPPKVVSERLGHSTVTFTMQVYAHVIPGMDEDLAQRLGPTRLAPRMLTRMLTRDLEESPDALMAGAFGWPLT